MSNEESNRMKHRPISSDNCLLILEKLNSTPTESWSEGNFTYDFFRFAKRINVQPSCFLKATNLKTNEVRAIKIPPSIESGREALNWATTVSK